MIDFPSPLVLADTEATRKAGRAVASRLRGGMLVALAGNLGAGKTTLTQGLLAALGAEPPYPSPTFILMHQYDVSNLEARQIRRVYHIDAYRVEAKDLEKVGWDEWRSDPEGVMIVEWPERVKDLLPSDAVWIELSVLPEGGRRLE